MPFSTSLLSRTVLMAALGVACCGGSALAQNSAESAAMPVKMRLVMRVPGTPLRETPLSAPVPGHGNPTSSGAVSSTTTASTPVMSTIADLPEMPASNLMERTILLSSSDSKFSTVVKPGQERTPFTAKEKLLYSLRESVSPEQAFVVTLSAGYNHFIDGNPHYGSDAQGFGEREGAAALRETSIHLLGDGAFASAFHQDPRYFRQGYGIPFRQRFKHVFVSAFTSHADSDGHMQLDYSGLLARAVTAGETIGYYPHVSANGTVASETFGYSILGEMSGNAFLEFWPDIIHRRVQ